MHYSELQTTSNYSFLQSGSHPEELVASAAILGHSSIAITDWMTLGGIVRAHTAGKQYNIPVLFGCALPFVLSEEADRSAPFALVYPTTKRGYEELSFFLSSLHIKESSALSSIVCFQSMLDASRDFVIVIPSLPFISSPQDDTMKALSLLKDYAPVRLYLGVCRYFGSRDEELLERAKRLSDSQGLPLVAVNDVRYHTPERRAVLDALTCVRLKVSIQEAGTRLLANAERYLKSTKDMYRLFRSIPEAVERTQEISDLARGFQLNQLSYEYPDLPIPAESTQLDELIHRVYEGATERFPAGIPPSIENTIEQELALIHELRYEKYFLTCHEIVRFAKQRGILCQGRGAAANSVVCYCLGITAVNPLTVDLLFARFVSKERLEPPDIDIDFEHQRREEVIQFIYNRFGREHAALTAEIITYRLRSALKDLGKAFGLDSATVSQIASSCHRWTSYEISDESLREAGLDPHNLSVRKTIELTNAVLGFPRHRSQHVGGFIISQSPLNRIVPIIPAAMEGRAIVEWDKDDIEELGILKIDILALGMLSCIRRSFSLINERRRRSNQPPVALYTVPTDDKETYDMICNSDTIGVFQIESRAQMSMLPRLRPRCFYDLVIEVAIVRPGPIHGDMVHPYLRRRSGKERVTFPDENVKRILGKTLGVPLFQEQAMRLAICLAGFSPGEAEQLRRAMAAWKRHEGIIEQFKKRIVEGMTAHGYSLQFAETCMSQIKGFSEYGFPESHAASFALIVLASAWIKRHYPAEFCASLLNSQPMGFYAPAQILRDAQNHGVTIYPIDINHSDWETTVDAEGRVRLGMHLIKGFEQQQAELIALIVRACGPFSTIQEFWKAAYSPPPQPSLRKEALVKLARANAFGSMNLSSRDALWEIRGLSPIPIPIRGGDDPLGRGLLPLLSLGERVTMDYEVTGFSATAHPIALIRRYLEEMHRCQTWKSISENLSMRHGAMFTIAGLVLVRQRPGTAKGVVFLSLEDETGITNVIISPPLFEKTSKEIMTETALLIRGTLQRIGPVVYCIAREVHGITQVLHHACSPIVVRSKSYSY